MSSVLRRMERKGKNRKRLTTRGKRKTPTGARRQKPRGAGLNWLTIDHDLAHAKKDCRICHSTGTKQTAFVQNGKARLLACSCVPLTDS